VLAGKTNYYGGAYLTTLASLEPFYHVEDPEVPSFLAHVSAGSSSKFAKISSLTYVPQVTEPAPVDASIVIDDVPDEYSNLIDGQVIALTYPNPSGDGTTVTVNLTIDTDGTELYIDATLSGTITAGSIEGSKLTINQSSALDLNTINAWLVAHQAQIHASWDFNIEDFVIMSLYQNSPRSAITTVTIKGVDIRPTITENGETIANPYYNTMSFTVSEKPYDLGTTYTSKTLIASTDPLKVDGFGQTLYFDNIIAGNDYLSGIVYQDFVDLTATWPLTDVVGPLAGGRVLGDATVVDATNLLATLQQGWALANSDGTEDISLFFEPHCIPELAMTMKSLKENLFKFSEFVTGTKVASNDVTVAMGQFATARAALPNITGMTSYLNEFLMKELYHGEKYWGIPLGAVSVMLTQIMEYKLGGVAPMFTNALQNGQSLGGQIGKSVLKQKYRFTADHLDTLDALGLNPLTLAPPYGLMATSHKTLQSVSNISDWSYLGHQMAFDLFKKEVRTQVMIPQIGKPISPYYISLRDAQVNAILNKRLLGSQAIWSEGKVYVDSVNTDLTRAEKKFVIKVRVKVTPFSENVELVFENIDQLSVA
jgi:hypothetical protein